MTGKKAVFLDRDGTINIDTGYVGNAENFVFIDGAVEAIHLLNQNGFLVIVITNQSGVGRGYFTERDVNNLHHFINLELAKKNAKIDAFYYCPHHPVEAKGLYKIECNCRKPKTGLFEKAMLEFNIDAKSSYIVGDNITDIEAGVRLNMSTIFIGRHKPGRENFSAADNLLDAVHLILSEDKPETKQSCSP